MLRFYLTGISTVVFGKVQGRGRAVKRQPGSLAMPWSLSLPSHGAALCALQKLILPGLRMPAPAMCSLRSEHNCSAGSAREPGRNWQSGRSRSDRQHLLGQTAAGTSAH